MNLSWWIRIVSLAVSVFALGQTIHWGIKTRRLDKEFEEEMRRFHLMSMDRRN